MSLMQNLSKSVGYVVREVETKVEDFDAVAVTDVRRLLAAAERAEAGIVAQVDTCKGEIVAALRRVTQDPQVAEEAVAEIDKLVTVIRALFELA